MSTLRGILAAGVLAFLTSGCIKLDQSLTLHHDGSGKASLSYSLAEQSVVQMRAMLALRQELLRAQNLEPDEEENNLITRLLMADEDLLRAFCLELQPFGLTLEKLRVDSRGGWRHVLLDVHIADFSRLAESPFFRDFGFTLRRLPNEQYALIRQPAVTAGEIDPLRDPHAIRQVASLLGGMRLVFDVTTPGAIRDTNATERELRTASWVFDFDRDPNALVALQTQAFQILFDGRQLDLPQFNGGPQ